MDDSGIGWARAVHFDTLTGSVYLAGTASFAGTLNDLVIMRLNNLVDADGDGFYLGMGDCNDGDASINPNRIEIPNNGIDEDCDGADLIVGTNEIYLANQFKVFSIPTNDLIQLIYDENAPIPQLIQLIDFTGKNIQNIKSDFSQGKITIQLHDFPQGVYILNIHTSEGVAVKKIIKN